MSKHLRAFVLIACALTAAPAWADDGDTAAAAAPPGVLTRYEAGARLGIWYNLGDNPPKRDTSSANSFTTNFHDASFYFEVYGAMRLAPMLMGELSLGIANRGTVTFQVDNRSNVGNLLVYAILVQMRFYPLTGTKGLVQPYVSAGGGMYYGRRTVQFTSSYYYYPGLDEQTATKISYSIGGGFDYRVASSVALDFNVKYLPVNFGGNGLMTVKNYDALAFSIGAKYLTSGTGKHKHTRRRF